MSQERGSQELGLQDEAAFEASLIADADARLEETHVLSPAPEPAPPGGVSAPEGPSTRKPRWVGKRLGRYKLLRLLGEGSMGRVIQAMDVNLQRIVALKVLRKKVSGLQEHERVSQFLAEARVAAQIEHPNIVRIYEIDQHDGWWYIAMEMVEGETLKRVVKAAGRLAAGRACPIIADAATALAVLHEAGIIHRDVKPSNLMITRTGRGKLTDFGFVRREQPDAFGLRTVGTPQFMAPEALRPREQTAAMDVYSLGATLYYALTGKPPYSGSSLSDVVRQHLESPPPDLSLELPGCPPTLAQLIRRAMDKDPAARPTAAEMAAALRAESIDYRLDDSAMLPGGSTILSPAAAGRSASLEGAAPVELPARRRPRRRLWMWAAGSIALVAALAGVVAWQLLARPDLAQRFPDTPQTYGVRSPGELPVDAGRPEAPPFSWVGRVDVSGVRYAASRQGRFYWPIDSPAARLIRAEDFVGYATAEQARADNKRPAEW